MLKLGSEIRLLFESDQCYEMLDSESTPVALSFLKEVITSADLCRRIYNKKNTIPNSTILSYGRDQKPDCIAVIIDDTLWIVSRGTHTIMDVINNISWLLTTENLSSYKIPVGVADRKNRIWPILEDYLKDNHEKINKVCFTGHSLGGAVATALYLNFSANSNLSSKFTCKSEVYTFGAPLLIHEDSLIPSNNYINENIHNIVTEYDIIPRLLGRHPLSKCIQKCLSLFKYKVLEEKMKTYILFGNYYILKDRISALLPHRLTKLQHPEDSLYTFPKRAWPINIRILSDHNIKKAAEWTKKIPKNE
eukprot:gene10246-21377_t